MSGLGNGGQVKSMPGPLMKVLASVQTNPRAVPTNQKVSSQLSCPFAPSSPELVSAVGASGYKCSQAACILPCICFAHMMLSACYND